MVVLGPAWAQRRSAGATGAFGDRCSTAARRRRAAAASLEEVLRSRIFEPLAMRDTGFFTADTDRLATAYVQSPEGLQVRDGPDGAWSRPPDFTDGAAGLVSTVDDLLAFA